MEIIDECDKLMFGGEAAVNGSGAGDIDNNGNGGRREEHSGGSGTSRIGGALTAAQSRFDAVRARLNDGINLSAPVRGQILALSLRELRGIYYNYLAIEQPQEVLAAR